MNKYLKAIMCAGLCGTMVLAAACAKDNPDSDGSQTHNTETRALYLSIGAVDGNFNPFFYTSLTDGQVVSMTQSSLITTEVVKNPNGQNEVIPAAGDKYPTIAKDFTTTYYRPDGTKTNNSAEAADGGRTEYEFLIKNGMKFSNGSDITIKDVLFNFYVYLDPSYTGSNTMYSVDIQGLLAYQENDANLSDDDAGMSYMDEAAADLRIERLYDWSNYKRNDVDPETDPDLAKVKEFFKEELNTDWTSNATSWSVNYETNYNFKHTWEAYLFMEGRIGVQQRNDGTKTFTLRVDENGNVIQDTSSEAYKMGKTLTTLDDYNDLCNVDRVPGVLKGAYDIIDKIEEATSATKIAEYKASNPGSTDETAYEELSKEAAIAILYDDYTARDGIKKVITMWGTAQTAYNYFVADEHGKRTANSETPRYYISGLQTYKTSEFNGNNLGAEHDVFKIVVNDVDPAAIWQFGVSIAPMYYYSGTWTNPKTGVTKDYVASFNGDQNGGKGIIEPGRESETCFGLERDKVDFLTDVVKDTTKNGVPKGAGAYMAATDSGAEATNRSQFDNNGIINYVRNTNFETMGAEIENAKIKNLRYRIIDEDKIIASLNSGEIDYGEPNATPANMKKVEDAGQTLGSSTYQTNGYGYVGINAGKVPDVNVRRIIMSVMDTAQALRYYGQNLATNIYRSMSVTSWAYPEGVTTLPEEIYTASKTGAASEIKSFLLSHGYSEGDNGKLRNTSTGDYLKYTFTIAGANSDHPAYTMFKKAEEILNNAGFEINVSTDPNALMQLTRGGLAVWAAAWSAGVDPDMYQVWHKDSNATSVLNWGYDVVKKDTQKFSYEWNIITTLSEKIEAARATDDRNDRIDIYAECLDLVMNLAVELPIYQRNDLCVYNKTVIDAASLNQDPNCYLSLMNNIWEVNYL